MSQADLGVVVRARFPPGPLRTVEEPSGFRTTLADLAVRLLSAPPERVDHTCQETLETLTRTLGVDRCGLIQFADGGRERALIVTNGSTLSGDAFLEGARADAFAGASLDDMQRAHILSVLRQCGGKVAGKGNAAERAWG